MKLLIAYLIFTFGAIGFISFANAEDPDFTQVDPNCTKNYNSTVVTTDGNYTKHTILCYWEINEFVKASAYQENLTDSEAKVLDDIAKAKGNGTYTRPPFIPVLDQNYTGWPEQISTVPKSCTRNNPSPSDIEECNLDSKMGFCERGIQSTNPIQQYEHFAVSEYKPRDDLQIDLNNGMSGIVSKLKAYEECRAQLKLIINLNKTHYVGISNQVAKGEYNPYHADFVTSDFIFPAGITKADESEILFQDRKAHDTFCKIEYIHESLRKEQGCPKKVYEGTYKNLTGMGAYEARLKNTGPLAEYYKYMETEGVNYYPSWIKKHAVTITAISPGAEIVIELPRD